MKNRIMLTIVSLSMFGCAAGPDRISETPSGKPEVTFSLTDKAKIKGAIASEMFNQGYTLISDSDLIEQFSRPTKGAEDFVASMAAGNGLSSNTRIETFNLVPTDNGLRVVVTSVITSQLPGGQIQSLPLESTADFNAFQVLLNTIKSRLDGIKT
jgi:hypothetical protein